MEMNRETMISDFNKKYAVKEEVQLLKLQDRICQMCGCKIPRKTWRDKRQYCPHCLAEKGRKNSRKWTVIHNLKWIPESLLDKFPDIEVMIRCSKN